MSWILYLLIKIKSNQINFKSNLSPSSGLGPSQKSCRSPWTRSPGYMFVVCQSGSFSSSVLHCSYVCFGTFWLSFQPGHLVVQYVFVSGSFSSSVQLPPKVALMFCDIHFHQIWWVPKIFTFFLTFDPWAHSSQNGLAIKASHLNWLPRCDNGPQGLFYWKTWTLNQDLRSRSTEK